jgi:16S rRNA (guanine527-N7)-methyltransferase
MPGFSGSFCDLGSGGGIPGLVLLECWPDAQATLLDGSTRRCAFLSEALTEMGIEGRAAVLEGRAETIGHTAARESFDLVVARSFAAPPVTAECAAPLLRINGILVVAEPPAGGAARWSEAGLELLGLTYERDFHGGQATAAVMRKIADTPERFPRRVGIPAKRPLW